MIRDFTPDDIIFIEQIGTIINPEYKFKINPFMNCLVYEENNKVIGFISFLIIYEKAEIIDIAVSLEQQRQSIGTKLLDAFFHECLNKKCESITLEVRASNKSAISFYEKHGFREISIRKSYYRNGEDALIMIKMVIWVKDKYILAIETSCDETSASIVKNGCEEIGAVVLSQMDIHKLYGGVVPEIASRNHVENITMVIEETLSKSFLSVKDIDAIAVTYGPGLIGSLLIGLQAAKTLAFVWNKPLIPIHHIAGHIYANRIVGELKFPLITLVVSGGHTDLIYMSEDYNFKKLGGTLDDAVGEAYDKVAKVIGLDYPGGPLIDKLAQTGLDTYSLPTPLNDISNNFSFSGLKSAVVNLVHNEEQRGNKINPANMSKSFQERVVNILTKKTMRALKEYNVSNLMLAGGVAANKGLRDAFTALCEKNNIHFSIPPLKYCTDNATMIGAAAYVAYNKGIRADLSLNAKATVSLEKIGGYIDEQ